MKSLREGSPCGEGELCHLHDPPQAENSAVRDSSYAVKSIALSGDLG